MSLLIKLARFSSFNGDRTHSWAKGSAFETFLLLGRNWIVFEEALATRPLMDSDQESTVRQETLHRVDVHLIALVLDHDFSSTCSWRSILSGTALSSFSTILLLCWSRALSTNCVGYSTENQNTFVLITIGHYCHALIADIVKTVWVIRIFDLEPDFLIKQKQMQIVKQRRNILLAKFIVSSTSNKQSIISRQIAHSVSKSGARSISTSFYINKFTVYHFAINCNRFEIAEFIAQQLSILSSATKEIDTFLHHVTLSDCFLLCSSLTWRYNRANATLNERWHNVVLFELNFYPFKSV